MKLQWPLKPFDYLVLALSLALTTLSAFMAYAKPQGSQSVLIQGAYGNWVYPLEAEEQVVVPGPLGDTVVEIHNRTAAVISSPCPGQTCIAVGHITSNGQWIACLPNNVIVTIEGSTTTSQDSLDATVW